MRVVVKHLQRDKKSGLLNFRRRFPQDLVGLIPSNSSHGKGRSELKVSLRSSSINDPAARSRYAQAEAEFDALVAKARRVATKAYDKLDDALVRYLAETYVHDQVESDEAMRWGRDQLPARYATRGNPEEVYLECREMLEAYDAAGLVAYWGDWASAFGEALGYYINPFDREMPALSRALAEAACSVWLSIDRRIDGIPVETPAKPHGFSTGAKGAGPTAEPAEASLSLLELYERYAAVEGRHPKTVAQWRPYIRHLVAFLGTDDVKAITHDDLVRWRNHLRDNETYRGKPLSAKTINGSYLGSAAAVFSWAKGDGIIPNNPMREVAKVKLPKKPRLRSKAFTTEEALTILRASLVPPTSREKEDLRNAKRWCPWLMAYSGARVNEITQLRKEDILEQDGVTVMRITPEAGSVKTNTFRVVPLHSHLVEQGFLKFVQARPEGPLFFDPTKRRSDNAINRQANRLGTKLAAWVRTLGVEGVMPNHAWRHLFVSLAPRYHLHPQVTRAITGHASGDVHDDYATPYVDVMARELEKFPRFLETSSVQR